ncbi:MAG: UbiD family decarboxylase [Planctomycetota bacterium]
MREAVSDLERHGHLIRISQEIDPHLEAAAIQRRVYAADGPAIFFERLQGTPFPAVSNLFGSLDRARFMFRDTLERVKTIIRLKADPTLALRNPLLPVGSAITALRSLPMRKRARHSETTVDALPAIHSWPDDGGPFVTLPQVLSLDPASPRVLNSNVGMYRVQLSGNEYQTNREVGLHFQIQRGLGSHYSRAVERGERLPVSVFVGGPPAHTLAAVMPLPEGLSELLFAGMLGGRRFRYEKRGQHVLSSDADFIITGHLAPKRTKPEGPFGDHLGYYSLQHEFPVLEVDHVYHKKDAIWPFTVVGRPPQEDTTFGALIHELTGPMVPTVIPGLHALHAVDVAGVHPLLFAQGSERYVAYEERRPMELLTIANAVLGFGQASLAKYLMIVAKEDAADLDLNDEEAVFQHVLERFDPTRDLHFQTRTTIDTLDYSGTGLNEGSKVVWAAAGPKRRELGTQLPSDLSVPPPWTVKLVRPGILAASGTAYVDSRSAEKEVAQLAAGLRDHDHFPLVVICDDAAFASERFANFLWVTFTRSNPSHDVFGVDSFVDHKHWGCRGAVVIDARIKPHHAPPLVEDRGVEAKVDQLAKHGGPLHGVI